jgi:hypothetical protein
MIIFAINVSFNLVVNNICAKFPIIRPLHFSRITIQIVTNDPILKSCALLLTQIMVRKAQEYNFQFISKYIS